MREVDRLMIEGDGIALHHMMENAGGRLAEVARRHLANAGASITVALAREPTLSGDVPEHQQPSHLPAPC
jgi:hypothetical protein